MERWSSGVVEQWKGEPDERVALTGPENGPSYVSGVYATDRWCIWWKASQMKGADLLDEGIVLQRQRGNAL